MSINPKFYWLLSLALILSFACNNSESEDEEDAGTNTDGDAGDDSETTPDDEDCDDDETRCEDDNVERCDDGEWVLDDDCKGRDMTCDRVDGEDICVEDSDEPAETDSQTEPEETDETTDDGPDAGPDAMETDAPDAGAETDEGGEDAGADTQTEDAGPTGASCRSVDVVIAMDGSSSVEEERQALRTDVMPAFMAQLDSIADYRIATLDGCPDPANFHTEGLDGDCHFDGDNAWIESGSEDRFKEFDCVAELDQSDVACSGFADDEQPVTAAITALEAPWVDSENAGFLREDALLVLIVITDEDEQSTEIDSVQALFARLVALKGGDPSRMVFVAIGGGEICSGQYGDAEEAETLMALSELFGEDDRGVFWDLCEGSMADGLEDAISTIETACEDFKE